MQKRHIILRSLLIVATPYDVLVPHATSVFAGKGLIRMNFIWCGRVNQRIWVSCVSTSFDLYNMILIISLFILGSAFAGKGVLCMNFVGV